MKSSFPLIEDALLQLLTVKSLDHISVQEVCARAGVSRQTLYYHYESLSDVFFSWMHRSIREEMGENVTYESWAEGFRIILNFCARNRTVVLHVYHSSYRPECRRLSIDRGSRLIRDAIQQSSTDFNLPMVKKDEDFMVNFYTDAFLGLLIRFFDGDMKENPEYIVSRSELMMEHSIRETQRKFYDFYKCDIMSKQSGKNVADN